VSAVVIPTRSPNHGDASRGMLVDSSDEVRPGSAVVREARSSTVVSATSRSTRRARRRPCSRVRTNIGANTAHVVTRAETRTRASDWPRR
jgi:hypothetical protein